MNKTTKIIAILLSVLTTTAVVAGATYAYQGGGFAKKWHRMDSNKMAEKLEKMDPEKREAVEARIAEMKEKREAMDEVFENGTYEDWLAVQSECPYGKKMNEMITEENFEQFAEMHLLKQAGDYAGAKEIWKELGLEDYRKGHKKGFGKGMKGKCGMENGAKRCGGECPFKK